MLTQVVEAHKVLRAVVYQLCVSALRVLPPWPGSFSGSCSGSGGSSSGLCQVAKLSRACLLHLSSSS